MMHWPVFVSHVVTALSVWPTAANQPVDEAPRPNIVIILADDLGYGDLSCYGNRAFETPHLDALARSGMRLTDFHSSGAVCSPTRAGLLTGRYQQRAGIPGVVYADPKQNRHHGLHSREVTFAELLQRAGYVTAIFGKWHLGYRTPFNPIRHGFDSFRGFVSGNVDYISHVDRMGIADWWNADRLAPEEGYSTHLITQHSLRFIEENQSRPFCLYIAHEAVHSPYQAPFDKPVRAMGQGNIRGAARKDVKKAYQQMMTEMDRGVGEVVATLERLALAESTFLFFFSDNGANPRGSNGPLRGHKGSIWEGGHRVPAIASWPGHIDAGSESDTPAISLDIMPTMLELSGARLPSGHELDGKSLLPILTEEGQLPPRLLFWQHGQQSAVRDGPWKLVVNARNPATPIGLYDLSSDLGEERTVASLQPLRVKKMQATLKAWEGDVQKGATLQPTK